MQVTCERDEWVTRLPPHRYPVRSSSGKAPVVASAHGNRATAAGAGGRPVIASVIASIRRPAR